MAISPRAHPKAVGLWVTILNEVDMAAMADASMDGNDTIRCGATHVGTAVSDDQPGDEPVKAKVERSSDATPTSDLAAAAAPDPQIGANNEMSGNEEPGSVAPTTITEAMSMTVASAETTGERPSMAAEEKEVGGEEAEPAVKPGKGEWKGDDETQVFYCDSLTRLLIADTFPAHGIARMTVDLALSKPPTRPTRLPPDLTMSFRKCRRMLRHQGRVESGTTME